MQSKIILLQFVVELMLPILTTHAYMAYTIHISVYEEQHACGGERGCCWKESLVQCSKKHMCVSVPHIPKHVVQL